MLYSELMKTDLILKGKDAGDCARFLHALTEHWSQFSPQARRCTIPSCLVRPDFLAAWVCLMPDKSVSEALFLERPQSVSFRCHYTFISLLACPFIFSLVTLS